MSFSPTKMRKNKYNHRKTLFRRTFGHRLCTLPWATTPAQLAHGR